MAATREQQARHQAVRRRVLARLKVEQPATFDRWWLEARAEVEAEAQKAKRSAAARKGWQARQGVAR